MKTKKKSKLTNDCSKQIDDHFHRISFREIKILWTILRDLSLTRGDFVQKRFLQDGLLIPMSQTSCGKLDFYVKPKVESVETEILARRKKK